MKQQNKKPILNITIERINQTEARAKLEEFILSICEKYKLNYYDLFGIMEAIKMDFQASAETIEEEEE